MSESHLLTGTTQANMSIIIVMISLKDYIILWRNFAKCFGLSLYCTVIAMQHSEFLSLGFEY